MARKITDSNDVETAQPSPVEFDTVYAPQGVEVDIVAAPSNGGGDAALYEELRFMEEIVEVMVHESTDENAPNPVFTACNGVTQYFFRGEVQAVKRKYVNILASCKEHGISTPEYTAKDGSRAVGIRRTSSLKYPFSVISDKNPRGAAWLRSVLGAPT